MRETFSQLGNADDFSALTVRKSSTSKEGWEIRRGNHRLRVEELDIEKYIECLEAWHNGQKELRQMKSQLDQEGLGSYLDD
ncbi:MAG: hypothetical protein F4Y08_06620 [Caldilineaceae bacterium SB0662_bin_9]|uniref:Uncharacterized protein n=1 Tax=Caldilineaceae bacterium SB0662_bin_9 TaxID=2605258 RepID=A0A6B1DQJ2_9CHLR|nr:hypothetical protein [Caldilineaceae bacterium SB0662_bin_9]